MWLVIVYSAIGGVLAAASKPFWYDEISTIILSRQPHLSDIWAALKQGVDGQPPAYDLLERIASHVAQNAEVAYRLPSVLAFCCVLWCMFVFVRRHNGAVVAFLCSAALILTPLNYPYAVEARPYEVLVACIAFALVCYQRAGRLVWVVLLGCALVAAQCLHYYAFFYFVPFGMAEFVLALRLRRIRWGAWIALTLGLVPLAAFWPTLESIKKIYASHIGWDTPSLQAAARFYHYFVYGDFLLIYHVHFPYVDFVAAVAIALLAILMVVAQRGSEKANWKADSPLWDNVLGVVLLAVPFLGLALTKIAHGGYRERYFLSTLLCIPLMCAFMLRFLRRSKISFFLLAVILLAGVAKQQASFWRHQPSPVGRLSNPAAPVLDLVKAADRPGLPVVASDGVDYAQLAYYAPPELAKRLVAVVDAPQAFVYIGSDMLDTYLGALARYDPDLRVYQFSRFRPGHPDFLLYSDGSGYGSGHWDWWPHRLAADGYSLRVVAAEGVRRIYLVDAPTAGTVGH
jgi:hypothetical protein